MKDRRIKHHGRYERVLPTVPSYVPGEEIILDVLLAPIRDTHSEEIFFQKLIRRIHDPLESGPFMYTDIGATGISLDPAADCTRDPMYEGTGLENLQIRKSDVEEKEVGKEVEEEVMVADKKTAFVSDGQDFEMAQKMAKRYIEVSSGGEPDVRIAYGNKTWKFHFIDSDDRDYDFAVPLTEFVKMTEQEAKAKMLSPRVLGSRIDEMWNKMNDDEKFGCQFGMFPSWLHDKYKPTHEEIVELMSKGKSNVNASISLDFTKFKEDMSMESGAETVELWQSFTNSYDSKLSYDRNFENWKENKSSDQIASKKTAQDFSDTDKGAPKNEDPVSEDTSNNPKEEDLPIIDESFFDEEVDNDKSGLPSVGPNKGKSGEQLKVEPDIISQFTFLDREEYYKWVSKREEAEKSGNTVELDHINAEITNLIHKYQHAPDDINKETDMATFVKSESLDLGYLPLTRKLKTHTMFNRDDYQKLISSLDEKLFELTRFLKLTVLSASWYGMEDLGDEQRVDISLNIAGTKTASRNILIRMIKKGQKISVLPYFWDSLGRKYDFDDVGIKSLFNYVDTSKRVLDNFKEEG